MLKPVLRLEPETLSLINRHLHKHPEPIDEMELHPFSLNKQKKKYNEKGAMFLKTRNKMLAQIQNKKYMSKG